MVTTRLTEAGCRERRRRLWASLPAPCDLLLVTSPASLVYLAGLDLAHPAVFQTSQAGAVLVMESSPLRATLVVDNHAAPFLEHAHVDEVSAGNFYRGRTSAPARLPNVLAIAHDFLQTRRTKPLALGLEASAAPWGLIAPYADERAVDLDPVLRKMRRCKCEDEIAVMRRSLQAIDAGHAAALAQARAGMTELEVYDVVARAARDALGGNAPIYGDFASNPGGEIGRKGGPPTPRVLEAGDLFILDYSVIVQGYRGDNANTFAVGRPANDAQRALADACRAAIDAGETLLRPGVPARDVDRAVRAELNRHGHGDTFTSHVGHGLGLAHLEPPFLVPESDDILEIGNILTVEPAQYVQGVGAMRFEHNYLITADGFERLSRHALTIDAP